MRAPGLGRESFGVIELPIARNIRLLVNHKQWRNRLDSEWALRFFGEAIGRVFYRVSAIGREQVPAGGVLLLPNHITWVDAIVLQLAFRRPIRFIIDEGVYRNRYSASVPRRDRLHSDQPAQSEGCHARGRGLHSRGRNRLSLSGGRTFAARIAPPARGAATRSSRGTLKRRSSRSGSTGSGVRSSLSRAGGTSRNSRAKSRTA